MLRPARCPTRAFPHDHTTPKHKGLHIANWLRKALFWGAFFIFFFYPAPNRAERPHASHWHQVLLQGLDLPVTFDGAVSATAWLRPKLKTRCQQKRDFLCESTMDSTGPISQFVPSWRVGQAPLHCSDARLGPLACPAPPLQPRDPPGQLRLASENAYAAQTCCFTAPHHGYVHASSRMLVVSPRRQLFSRCGPSGSRWLPAPTAGPVPTNMRFKAAG